MKITKEELKKVKVGDGVERMLAGIIPMGLRVTEVTDDLIICGAYTFSRENGNEIDEDIRTLVSSLSRIIEIDIS
jgi:hypothetical protein